MQEHWKYAWGFSRYMISTLGRIRVRDTGHILVPEIANDGCLTVRLYNNFGTELKKSVHRLVADTFLYTPEGYTPIYFIDGDKKNVAVDNLTREEDFIVSRLKPSSKYIGFNSSQVDIAQEIAVAKRERIKAQQEVYAASHPKAKRGTEKDKSRNNSFLNRPKPKNVRVKETGEIYPSQSACGRALSINQSLISAVLRGRMRQAGGFTFEYVESES